MRAERSRGSVETAVRAAAVLVELAASPTTTTLREFTRLLEQGAASLKGIEDAEVKAAPSGARLGAAMQAASDALERIAYSNKERAR